MKIVKTISVIIYCLIFVFSINAQTTENLAKVGAVDTKQFDDKSEGITELINAKAGNDSDVANLKNLREKLSVIRDEILKATECHYDCSPTLVKDSAAEYMKLHGQDEALVNKFGSSESELRKIEKRIEIELKKFADKNGFVIVVDASVVNSGVIT